MELEKHGAPVGEQVHVAVTDATPIAVQALSTYSDLISFFENCEAAGLGEQQARNRLSALNQFLGYVGSAMMDPIGQELGDDKFLTTLADFIEDGNAKGRTPGTLNNLKTFIRQWAETYKKMVETERAPKFNYFYEALKYYLDLGLANGHIRSFAQAARDSHLPSKFIKHVSMFSRRGLEQKYLKNMADLEVIIKAPTTALTRFCVVTNLGIKGSIKDADNRTDFGKKITDLTAKPYCLKELTPALKKEAREFIKFKVSPSVIPLNRNKSWRVRPKSECGETETTFCTVSIDGKTFSSTAIKFIDNLERFFGALQALGYDPTKFSLAYLTDFKLISAYVDFMHERSGSITKTPIMLVTEAQSLMLRMTKNGMEKDFGYLLQQPEYADRLLDPVPRSEWQSWCARQVLLLKQYQGELQEGKYIKQGRNPEDPLHSILDRQHPITALLEIAENMRGYLEKNRTFMRVENAIAFERDTLLFSMFPTQPLRIKMFALMTHYKNNSGNLYQHADGSWAVRFLKSDFKNEKGAAADKDYDIPIEKELWPQIEHFLYKVRPLFNDKRPNVFISVSSKAGGNVEKKNDGRGDQANLASQIRFRSRQFLPGCKGFGPHGVRHIVAHDIIKNHVNGFQMAADVLHDKVETVVKHYAHVKAKDGHAHFGKYYSEMRNEWRNQA